MAKPELNHDQFSKEFNQCIGASDYGRYVFCLGGLAARLEDAAAGNFLIKK